MINNRNDELTGPAGEPGVEWLAYVETDPSKALNLFVRAWHPRKPPREQPVAGDGVRDADLPPALAALARLAREHPTFDDFSNPLLMPPQVLGPQADRLVFATENQGTSHWAVAWPLTGEADPPVLRIEDPWFPDFSEIRVEAEPLSRFLLQYLICETEMTAPCQAWSPVIPTRDLAPVLEGMTPIPLAPFSQAFEEGEQFYTSPGRLAGALVTGRQAVVSVGARSRTALEPLRNLIPWREFPDEPSAGAVGQTQHPPKSRTDVPDCCDGSCRSDPWAGGEASDPPF